jgi:hypothetical protein
MSAYRDGGKPTKSRRGERTRRDAGWVSAGALAVTLQVALVDARVVDLRGDPVGHGDGHDDSEHEVHATRPLHHDHHLRARSLTSSATARKPQADGIPGAGRRRTRLMEERKTPPSTAVAPISEYRPGWMCHAGSHCTSCTPARPPNDEPSMMDGMNNPPGTAAPHAMDISTMYVHAKMPAPWTQPAQNQLVSGPTVLELVLGQTGALNMCLWSGACSWGSECHN